MWEYQEYDDVMKYLMQIEVGIQTRRERMRRQGRGCCRECKTRWQVDLSDPDPTFDENNQTRKAIQKFKKLPMVDNEHVSKVLPHINGRKR